MKKTLILIIFISSYTFAQAPAIQWQKCLGGTNSDYSWCNIQQTSDGGYIMAGFVESNDGNVSGNHGGADGWVVKLSSSGSIQWQKCLGGTNIDEVSFIQQTTDGGYILSGSTSSNDGDVSGNHGLSDAWIVKLSSNGLIQWQKCLGGTSSDMAKTIQQTTDGGYIIGGHTRSNNGDVSGNHGTTYDIWIVKMSSSGIIEWQKCYGGSADEFDSNIQQTTDGGYIFSGKTYSNNGDVSGNHGTGINDDAWVVKLSSSGVIQWQKCIGGSARDYATNIQQTIDGGYIFSGATTSTDGDVSGNHGEGDAWVVKLSSNGVIQWQRCLGGINWDDFYDVYQTNDGGYVFAGNTSSNDGDVSGNHGASDAWVVKLSSSGTIQWQKCIGGANDEADYKVSISQTTDGGFILSGTTTSNDGDISGNHGGYDYLVVKLASDNLAVIQNAYDDFQLYPNPVLNVLILTIDYNRINQPYVIIDGIGRVVFNGKLNDVETSINVEQLSKGIYYIKLADNSASKFIKE